MARVAYIPIDENYQTLFSFLGITLNTYQYGPNTGWDPQEFGLALSQAKDMLDNDTSLTLTEEQFEYYFSLLEGGFTVYYWSTESYHQN